jgi:anion-transporting  ArsA/GET3 family ATPase
MFVATEENQRILDQLVGCFQQYGRGDVIPHDVLIAVTGTQPPDSDYFQTVMAARKRFRDVSGIWTRPENGIGFRLLTVKETLVEEPRRRARKAMTQSRFSRRAAEMLPEKELKFHERRLRDAVIQEQRDIKRKLMESQRHLGWLMMPTPTNPK